MKKINAISILLSGKCNLNCSFCFLHKNLAFTNLHEIVQNAWKDKTYLSNVEQVLNKLNVDLLNISHITLWGGEPLLNLEYFNNSIKELFEIFPNINNFWTSTNFNINIQDLIQLLINIDEQANQKIEFVIQISMDSIFANQGHNLPLSLYKDKLKLFISELNKIQFNYINLGINFRTTINEDYFLNNFQNPDIIISHINFIKDLENYINTTLLNKKVSLLSNISPTPAYPTHATSLDGIQFNNIGKIWHNIIKQYNLNEELFQALGHISNNKNLFTNNYECNNLVQNLTILPDGTISNCINNFISAFPEYEQILKNNNDIQGLKELESEKIFVFNPLQMTTKQLEKQLYMINKGIKNNISTYTSLAMGMCEELALSKQIDEKYINNKELLLQHIYLINNILGCMFYNLHETQLPFMQSPSFFRKYLNGLIDQITDYHNNINYIKGENSNDISGRR